MITKLISVFDSIVNNKKLYNIYSDGIEEISNEFINKNGEKCKFIEREEDMNSRLFLGNVFGKNKKDAIENYNLESYEYKTYKEGVEGVEE